jgi:phage tail sheath protein FI
MTTGRPGVFISERVLPAQIASFGTANAAGAVVAPFEKGPSTVTLVASWYDFAKKFGGYNTSFPATFNVSQFFKNGGTELYVRRVLHDDADAAAVILQNTASTPVQMGTFTAKNVGADGNNLRVQVLDSATAGYFNVTVYQEVGGEAGLADDVVLELWQNVVFTDQDSKDFAGTVLALSEHVSYTSVASPTGSPSDTPLPLTAGSDGGAIVAADFGTAVADYSDLARPLVVFAPDAAGEDLTDVYDELIPWVEQNNSFLVIDTEGELSSAEALAFAEDLNGGVGTSYAAVYYPNIFIQDPLGRSAAALRKIGPSGSVAGIILSTDRQVGPFKSPAGIRASIVGALAPEVILTSTDLDNLNKDQYPVNAIRSLPGAGVVVYGARTLLQDGTANKYVAMRRSLNYLRKRITDLTQFAVFENNNEALWKQVRTVLGVFLNEYRNQGGLRGASPADAYFVKCDAENNTPQNIANGEVTIEVGVALEYPAEFVVITLSQKTIS